MKTRKALGKLYDSKIPLFHIRDQLIAEFCRLPDEIRGPRVNARG
jgi:hypothetical protein